MAFGANWTGRAAAAAMGLMPLLMAGSLRAEELPPGMGQPKDWQMTLQGAASETMIDSVHFHALVMWIISAIVLFVLVLIIYVIFRFNRKANPVPSKTTHNTAIEIAWTVIPIIILVFIAIPSFKLLYKQLVIPPPELTIKATGNQWNWEYEYPDQGGFSFVSVMIPEKDLKPGQPRLLAVDNEVVVPVDTVVRVQVTASDVIHSFTVPSFGIKIDAVPGRLNETWFKATRKGTFYGQCSELCGTLHAFMPIAVRVVDKAEFDSWAKQKSAALDGGNPNKVALATPASE